MNIKSRILLKMVIRWCIRLVFP